MSPPHLQLYSAPQARQGLCHLFSTAREHNLGHCICFKDLLRTSCRAIDPPPWLDMACLCNKEQHSCIGVELCVSRCSHRAWLLLGCEPMSPCGTALQCTGVPVWMGLHHRPLHHVPSHAVHVPSLHLISRGFSK